jgi:hypothetical protein
MAMRVFRLSRPVAVLLLLVTGVLWLTAGSAQAASGKKCNSIGTTFQVCVQENDAGQFNAVASVVIPAGQSEAVDIDLIQCRPSHPAFSGDCDVPLPTGCGFVGSGGVPSTAGPKHVITPTNIVNGALGHTYLGCGVIFHNEGNSELLSPEIAFP